MHQFHSGGRMAQKKQKNERLDARKGFQGFEESTDGMKAGRKSLKPKGVAEKKADTASKTNSSAPVGPTAPPPLPKKSKTTAKRTSVNTKKSETPKKTTKRATTNTASVSSPKTVEEKTEEADLSSQRRTARRRPAGPVRERIAANDDVPSIGGLIYALQQKPSTEPFKYAAVASAVWAFIGITFGWLALSSDISAGVSILELLGKPTTFLTLTAIVMPISVIWFLAILAWRAEELRLRSSTMTEVAVRLAEPDRMAEQSVASLGQAVRRQVSFMNDAVSRALGRAGELEALVHGEVAALESSYEENERKIKGLINELANERSALIGTGGDFIETLRTMGKEVPELIEKLSGQQEKLTNIIASAGENLTTLESSMASSAERIGHSLGSRTEQLKTVISDYTENLDTTLSTRTEALQEVLGSRTDDMRNLLGDYTSALATALGSRTEQIEDAFHKNMEILDASIGQRTDNLQVVFEEYGKALDATLANRAETLDAKLIERTRALDEAFNQRLQLFDASIMKSTKAIDTAVGEKALALTTALDSHAKTFHDTISQQSADLDESLVHGINAVRRSSENITRQSLKAIEGLAGQSELLKNVSENLLGQINSVSNRFDKQSQSIMNAASALENANYKIDSTLRARHSELSSTLDRLSGKADEFGKFVVGYSNTIEGSLSEAEERARLAAEEFKSSAQSQQRMMLEDFDKLRADADMQSSRALEDLRSRFASVSDEVSSQLNTITSSVENSTDDLRQKTARAANEIAREQERLKNELASIPAVTREGSETMRRALQDQMKALEKLSEISLAQARNLDVSKPVAGPPRDENKTIMPAASGISQLNMPNTSRDKPTTRGLSSLSSSVAKELASRPAASGQSPFTSSLEKPTAAVPTDNIETTKPGDAQKNWELGDLLQNASFDDEVGAAATLESGNAQPSTPGANGVTNNPAAPISSSAPASSNIDIAQIARSITPAVAAQVWERLRTGERGFLSKAMYTPEGRIVFDDISYRFQTDPSIKQSVLTFLGNFEKSLRDAEKTDQSNQQMQARLTSDPGLVYLFLAHVSGRLS